MRGGLLGLLCFFCLVSSGISQDITLKVNRDVKSQYYGQISIGDFDVKILDTLHFDSLEYAEWVTFFNVKVEGADRPVLGSYAFQDNRFVFDFRFLPDPNINYDVTFSPGVLKSSVPDFVMIEDQSLKITFENIATANTEVETVFPEHSELPSNILRFYIQFSAPIGFQNPYDFIHIEDSNGNRLVEPFVEIENGLWNPERTRLTLLMHPGRIKRGVGPNVVMGEIFEFSKSYKLVVSDQWESRNGGKLKQGFEKEFRISDAVRTKIDIEKWDIVPPTTNSSQELIVRVDHNLDQALIQRMISIVGKTGAAVPVSVRFDDKKGELRVRPKYRWNEDGYTIVINPKLEDVCGNTPLHAFDFEGKLQVPSKDNLTLNFELK